MNRNQNILINVSFQWVPGVKVTWPDTPTFLVAILEGVLYTNLHDYQGSDGNLGFDKQDSISVQCVRDDSKRSRLVFWSVSGHSQNRLIFECTSDKRYILSQGPFKTFILWNRFFSSKDSFMRHFF